MLVVSQVRATSLTPVYRVDFSADLGARVYHARFTEEETQHGEGDRLLKKVE